MDYVSMSGRKIPVSREADVFVAGGGCAGVGAAISAARNGAKTLMAERMFSLGGMMTGGLMSKIAIAQRNNGLAKELLERLDAYQGSKFLSSRPEVPIDPEITKLLLDRMVIDEAKAEVMFGTTVTDVITDGRAIKTVIIDSINGLEAVKAKYYIDCTGDGQLGFKAGASYVVGNPEGFSSSPTLMFRIGNVDIDFLIAEMEAHPDAYASEHERYSNHRLSPRQNRENIAADKYAHFADFIPLIKRKAMEHPGMFTEWELEMMLQRGLIFMNQPKGTHVLVNSTRIPHFRGNDNRELTNAVVAGRKQVEATFKFMKQFVPGFKDSFLMDTASLLGIRESRRITGDYIFTEKDIYDFARFDDAIVSNHGGIEIHSTTGEGTDIRELGPEEFYNVPYRSIISKDFDNLYMAGRCFSANHPGLSAARNIAYCMALGQAAGTAGAQLSKAGKHNVRDVNIKALQEKLAAII